MISHSDFTKLDLCTGKIKSVEKIENTTKLYKILVDIKRPDPIQIISGLAESYTIENLTGKNIVVLESQGMLLAAVDENKNISLLVPDKEMPSGTKIY